MQRRRPVQSSSSSIASAPDSPAKSTSSTNNAAEAKLEDTLAIPIYIIYFFTFIHITFIQVSMWNTFSDLIPQPSVQFQNIVCHF